MVIICVVPIFHSFHINLNNTEQNFQDTISAISHIYFGKVMTSVWYLFCFVFVCCCRTFRDVVVVVAAPAAVYDG